MRVITQARRLPLWRSYSLSHRLLQPQGRGARSAAQSRRASFNRDSRSIDRCLQQSSKFQLLLPCLLSEPSTWLKLLGSVGCEACVTLQRPEPPSVPPENRSGNGPDSGTLPHTCTSWAHTGSVPISVPVRPHENIGT